MSWVLIISIYSLVSSNNSAIAMTSVKDFSTQATCEAAGKSATNLVNPTSQTVRYVCVQQ